VEAEDPWIRAAPPTARMLAGYVLLHNRSPQPLALVGARSERFALVEVHETVDVGGVARMREVPRIEIAPAATLSLQPGGKHLMLMRPQSVPAEGESVEIVLELSDGSELPLRFQVRRQAVEAAPAEHPHQH
jgi:copper(I)-binding protein